MNRKIVSFCMMLSVMFAVLLLGGCSGKKTSEKTFEKTSERTGVIGAMEEEVGTLKEAITDLKTSSVAGMEFYEGKLDGVDVVVVQCGMGKVNAGICANTLINNFGCTKIINTGVAGSLDAQIDIGDIVVSTDAVQHDFTVEAIGFKKGEIPYTGRFEFPADEPMRKAAVEAVRTSAPEVKVFEGRICTGDQFISSQEQRNKIITDFGGMCCEMEGGAIAQACYLNKTPFVILRAISDKADQSEEMNYEKFKEQAAKNCASIVRYMVTH
ncbi:adenosylhomocysteine nucleosidase [[Clostridium] aminophilum]|uniref:adenosylhomocysteine nucleosidase n=1 Tax=[Clostridium] aminophilum TaxID=1526 RepID=A0A1I0A425_9FIRM|nr:adenosylhomocysteine nucleosidase [[Clostridium] aminophilum]